MGAHHRIIDAMKNFTIPARNAMKAPGWIGRAMLLLLMCGLTAAAQAATPVLPGSAFVAPSPCRVDPFSDASPDQREREFNQACGRDRPGVRFVKPDPRRLGMEADQLLTRPADPLRASVRLGWSGAQEAAVRGGPAMTGRADAAAGMRMRVTGDWALDVKLGRAAGTGPQKRHTVAALWRPGGENLLFTQWAEEEAGLAHSIGMRWWLLPGKVVFDLTARRPPAGGTVEPRIGLSWFGLRL